MREQTRRNIMYVAGLEALNKLSKRLKWNEQQYKAALAELVRQLQPTLAEI
jgi:hypothetical protein